MADQRSKLSACPDSLHASERQRELDGLAFSDDLEREYVASRLSENRAIIRVTCVLGALLSLFCAVRNLLEGTLGFGNGLQIMAVFLASVALATVACTSLFERLYLPLAGVVVPLRNALAAVLIARVASEGQLETLMILPLMVVGPFFLLGLPPRIALLSVVVTIASFIVSAAVLPLALSPIVFACALLLMITVACVVAIRQIDAARRKAFLESRLVAEFAEHDALTGTKNRRVFDEHLDRLWKRAIDGGRSIAVLLVDVDHFKKYNDRYGHQAGDRALRRVAQTLQRFADRPVDVLARYGGEEFALVLDDADHRQAACTADRMRRAISDLAIEQRDGVSGRVTVSVGVAAVAPAAGRHPRGALQLADQALYEAKRRGRNRIELKQDADYTMLVTGVFSKNEFPAPRDEAGVVAGSDTVQAARA